MSLFLTDADWDRVTWVILLLDFTRSCCASGLSVTICQRRRLGVWVRDDQGDLQLWHCIIAYTSTSGHLGAWFTLQMVQTFYCWLKRVYPGNVFFLYVHRLLAPEKWESHGHLNSRSMGVLLKCLYGFTMLRWGSVFLNWSMCQKSVMIIHYFIGSTFVLTLPPSLRFLFSSTGAMPLALRKRSLRMCPQILRNSTLQLGSKSLLVPYRLKLP